MKTIVILSMSYILLLLWLWPNATEGSIVRVGTRKLLIADSCYFEGCIEIQQGIVEPGASLILGDCTHWKYGFDEQMVDDTSTTVRFRSRLDRTYCMQAAHGPKIRAGVKLRLYPCSSNNQAQLFTWTADDIHPIKDPNLCVVYAGRQANVNIDPIILRKCNPRKDTGWSYD